MGGRKSRTVYVDNPQTLKLLEEIQKNQLERLQQEQNNHMARLHQENEARQRKLEEDYNSQLCESEERNAAIIREQNERSRREAEENRIRLENLFKEYAAKLEINARELQRLQQSHAEDVKKLQEMSDNLEKIKEEARRAKNPHMFKQVRKEAINTFVEMVRNGTLQLFETIPKADQDERHIAFIGPICCGKSTIIKAFTGVNVRTGMGHTTTTCTLVFSDLDRKLFVWDAPGINEDFDFYDPATLGFIKSLHKVFVVFSSSIKSVENVIRVCSAINAENMIFVRSKCDDWDVTDEKTIPEELEVDKEELRALGFDQPTVLPISARNVLNNSQEVFDWNRLLQQIDS